MKKLFPLIILIFCFNVKAVGESAVITLDFPAGAENTGLGEIGVSYANTIYSVFWNPANIANLYEETYLNHIYTSFHEDLLPAFGLDLYHDFYAFSTTLNDIFPHVDIGYAYFKNYLNFGETYLYSGETYDTAGIVIDTFFSDETVKASCLGVRVFDIFSIGLTFKKFDSQLCPGISTQYPNDGTAQGNAFDIGIRVNKKFEFLDLFYVNPAIGVSALNLGNDSANYIDISNCKSPLPRKGIIGTSCDINALDIIGYTFIYEVDYNLLSKSNERIIHIGHKIQLTPFYAKLIGIMDDTAGCQYEKYDGYVLSFNFIKMRNMVSKVIKLIDILNNTNNFDNFTKWDDKLSISGFKFKPNFFISKSHSVILSKNTSIARHLQTRDDWSVGIGIVGGFPNFFEKNKNQNTNDDLIINEEDGQIVE